MKAAGSAFSTCLRAHHDRLSALSNAFIWRFTGSSGWSTSTTRRCRAGGITAETMTAAGTPIWSLLQIHLVDRLEPPTPD